MKLSSESKAELLRDCTVEELQAAIDAKSAPLKYVHDIDVSGDYKVSLEAKPGLVYFRLVCQAG